MSALWNKAAYTYATAIFFKLQLFWQFESVLILALSYDSIYKKNNDINASF